jgi:hypothetical protein
MTKILGAIGGTVIAGVGVLVIITSDTASVALATEAANGILNTSDTVLVLPGRCAVSEKCTPLVEVLGACLCAQDTKKEVNRRAWRYVICEARGEISIFWTGRSPAGNCKPLGVLKKDASIEELAGNTLDFLQSACLQCPVSFSGEACPKCILNKNGCIGMCSSRDSGILVEDAEDSGILVEDADK